MVSTPFADQLRQWRKERRLVQKEAAAILHISVRTYQNYEYGINVPAQTCEHCMRERMKADIPTVQ